MKITVIKEPKLYCEDNVGDFIGIVEEGDYVKIKANGIMYKGTVEQIYSTDIRIETTEFETVYIKLSDIEEVLKD